MNELAGKHIVLGLSGGIACYKAAELCRALVKAGATVQVVMTEAAEQFMTAVTMQALSGRPVFTSQWDARTSGGADNNMPHINLSREADAIVVAPASADFMAKLVHGRADELLSLMCLARPIESVPLILAPAMNREMWSHPATQRNIEQLRADGATVLDVGAGEQACGETGDGRMLEPDELLYELVRFFAAKPLAGQHVLTQLPQTFMLLGVIEVFEVTETHMARRHAQHHGDGRKAPPRHRRCPAPSRAQCRRRTPPAARPRSPGWRWQSRRSKPPACRPTAQPRSPRIRN